MAKRFRAALATLRKGRYLGIEFPALENSDDLTSYATPLPIKLACGENMAYGALFSYLFRRFGYPNHPWDGYKEFTKYLLTTPMKEMILQVVPSCDDSTEMHFAFLVPYELYRKFKEYEDKELIAWRERMFDWIEANNMLPEWIDDGVAYLNRGREKPLTWRQLYDSIAVLHHVVEGAEKPVSVGLDWQREVCEAYRRVEPSPPCQLRSYDWREWPDEDPLKAYAQAAYETLLDLKRPVRMRDMAINAFGAVEDGCRSISEPAVAGYPSGALGNVAPEEFADLALLVKDLGNGDVKEGIKKLLELSAENLSESKK